MSARIQAFVRTYIAEVNNDRLLGLAAEMAFFAVLGIFPGLLIAAASSARWTSSSARIWLPGRKTGSSRA